MDHVDRFVMLLFAGTGMLLAGGVNLLTPARHVGVRTGLTLVIAVLTIGGTAIWSEKAGIVAWVAILLSLGLVPCLLGGRAVRTISRFLGFLFDRGVVRWGLLAAVGVLLIAGSVVLFQAEDDTWTREETEAILASTYMTNHVESSLVRAVTDRGNTIKVTHCLTPRNEREVNENARLLLQNTRHIDFVIQREPAGELCNCHGWIFTGGRYGILGQQVDQILTDNGYQPVTQPKPGDLVIYRFSDGRPSHTALVRVVAPDMPVFVEGKWGWMGVYLHDVDKSLYGTDFTYYRSGRPGHLLRLSETSPSSAHP